jgi:hypothetical protein
MHTLFDALLPYLPRQLKVDHFGPVTMPLHNLHAMALKYGEDQFAQKGACTATFLIAVRTDVLWLESDFGDWQHRKLVYRFIRDFLHVSDAHAYSFLSEVFVAVYKPDEDPASDDFVLPRDRRESERDEMLMVSSFDKKGASFFSKYLITPSRRPGKLAWLGPRVDEHFAGNPVQGMAFDLFKRG